MSKIEWAPLSVPIDRRLQTFSAAVWVILCIFGPFICVGLFISLLLFGNVYFRALCLIYVVFIFWDRHTADNGGRGNGILWMRNFILWKYYRDYFPTNIIKTVDLSPNRNYLLAIFPHGILCSGVFANLVTNLSKWNELFPGIRTRILTLNLHFNIPFYRELILSWGLAASSSKCLKLLLCASNDPKDPKNNDGCTSNAVSLIVGGASEALYCHPGNYQIVLKKRKGFVRLAIETGCPIVPVFSFGEVDVFDQPPNPSGSRLRRFQEYIKKITGMSPIMFKGRGFFQYTFGFIPQRKPITTIVGAPIEVIQNSYPPKEEIDKVHARFVEALVDLFETHKSKYIPDSEDVHLIIE